MWRACTSTKSTCAAARYRYLEPGTVTTLLNERVNNKHAYGSIIGSTPEYIRKFEIVSVAPLMNNILSAIGQPLVVVVADAVR